MLRAGGGGAGSPTTCPKYGSLYPELGDSVTSTGATETGANSQSLGISSSCAKTTGAGATDAGLTGAVVVDETHAVSTAARPQRPHRTVGVLRFLAGRPNMDPRVESYCERIGC